MEVYNMAIRTQIYLSEEFHKSLRDRAKTTGKSMAEQIRESLALYLAEAEANTPKPEDALWKMAGHAESKDHNLSTHHDDHLYPEKGNEE